MKCHFPLAPMIKKTEKMRLSPPVQRQSHCLCSTDSVATSGMKASFITDARQAPVTDAEVKESKSSLSVSRSRLFPWSTVGKAEEHSFSFLRRCSNPAWPLILQTLK